MTTTIITALATFLIGGIIGTTTARRNDTPHTLPGDFDYALHHARTLINQGLPGKALNYLDRVEEQNDRQAQAITNHKNQATRLIQRTTDQ